MFCSQCGTIIGREALKQLYKCPKCQNAVKVASLKIVDEVVEHEFLLLDGTHRKLCGLFMSEAMLKFFLTQKTSRVQAWLPVFKEIEEERMKAFAKKLGWIISGIYQDPGPGAKEGERPFAKVSEDIDDGALNAMLVTDFSRIARKDLFQLSDLCREKGIPIYSIAPHQYDENLVLDNFDYDSVSDDYASNPIFETFWNERCDKIIEEEVRNMRWFWTFYIADLLVGEIKAENVKAWSREDSLCREMHWKDALAHLAIARMKKIGLIDKMPLPRLKNCETCKRKFLETTIPLHLLEICRFKIRFCRTCLNKAFFFDEEMYRDFLSTATRQEMADFDESIKFFQEISWEKLVKFIKASIDRSPSLADRTESDTWLRLLIESEILTDFEPVTKQEAFYRAEDGHPCLNIGTVLIDNFLSRYGIKHRIEIKYPKHIQYNPLSNIRSDFQVGETYVEYLGFRGRDEFLKKIEEREALCERNRLRIIKIYTEDLLSVEILKRKLRAFMPPEIEEGSGGAEPAEKEPVETGSAVEAGNVPDGGPKEGSVTDTE